ncbi:putative ribonuclease H-like domain-containing protein [Tanacetum coccineum]
MPDCMLTPPTNTSIIIYTQLSSVQGVDTQSHFLLTIQSQFSDINLSFISQQAIASHVIDDVMKQLSFKETKLDGEAGFIDVARSGMESSGLSHDESFGVDDLDLNLNETVNLNVSQIETQSKLPVSEEPAISRTQEPIVAEVSIQEPIVAEVSTQVPIVEEVRTQEFTMEDVVLEDYVSSGEDAEQCNGQEDESAPNDDDEDFLVDEENETVKPDVDVNLFGISRDNPFDNISVTNLVPGDVLEGGDVDVINLDGFDNDPGNNDETNDYRKRRIRAGCDGKVLIFTMSQGTRPTGLNRGIEVGPSGSSGPSIRSKKRKNTGTNDDSQASSSILNAHDKGDLCLWVLETKHCTYKFLSEKIFDQVRVNLDILVKAVQDQLQRELEVQISMSKAFRAKAKAKREIRVDHRIYVCLGAFKLGFRACRRDLLGLDGAFMKGPFLGQVLAAVGIDSNNRIYPLAHALVEAESKSSWCWFLQYLGDDIDLHLNSNFTFISDTQKCGQAYKDLLWRDASATSVKEFEKCMLELKTMNPKVHEWLNKIPPEHWARSYFSGRAKFDLLLNNICEVFNGKIVGGRDKPLITLLESIREYCMKRIVGQPRKKRKRSKHEDEPFVKDGKLSRKGRTITFQSYGNTGHNKAICKGQCRKATTGGNNAEASGSASRQAQQTEPAVGQDGLGGLGVGAVIGLSAATGQGCPGGAGVGSQVLVGETRNADGREMGDDIPTQSSAAGGASEWSFL